MNHRIARQALALSFVVAYAAGNQLCAAESPAASPVLLELFTSEGCSSCPPADAFLEKLDASQPVRGALLIVLSEHVDYWNHDGWKDPYSSAAFTDRQGSYARVLKIGDIYTPQLIVDGTTELHLSNPNQTGEILQKAAATRAVPLRIDSVAIGNGSQPVVRGRVESDGTSETRGAEVYVVVALNRAESQVLRGENSGRRLTHVAVVESLKKIGKLENGKSFGQDFQIKLKPGTDPANIRLIAFVQEPGPGRVLGAALRKPPFQ
jgi:hypothetical protein